MSTLKDGAIEQARQRRWTCLTLIQFKDDHTPTGSRILLEPAIHRHRSRSVTKRLNKIGMLKCGS